MVKIFYGRGSDLNNKKDTMNECSQSGDTVNCLQSPPPPPASPNVRWCDIVYDTYTDRWLFTPPPPPRLPPVSEKATVDTRLFSSYLIIINFSWSRETQYHLEIYKVQIQNRYQDSVEPIWFFSKRLLEGLRVDTYTNLRQCSPHNRSLRHRNSWQLRCLHR